MASVAIVLGMLVLIWIVLRAIFAPARGGTFLLNLLFLLFVVIGVVGIGVWALSYTTLTLGTMGAILVALAIGTVLVLEPSHG